LARRKRPQGITFIGPGTTVEGDLRAEGGVRVDGVVLGSLFLEGDLEVAPGGRVEGEEVRARNVVINGEVKARVHAEGKLVLTKSGRLEGDIHARALDIEAGAVFVGRSVTGEVPALEPPPVEEG